MKIEITRTGIYDQAGNPVPVGTQLDVPDDFHKWANKYRVVSSGKGKTLEPATPERTAEEQEWLDAPAVGREVIDDDPLTEGERQEMELSELRAEYERVFSRAPHHKMKAETIRRKLGEVD